MSNDYKLEIVRGDSFSFMVKMKDKQGTAIPFNAGDIVYFTVKKSPSDSNFLIQKKIESFNEGNAFIEIKPEDTKPLAFTSYAYDIQWTRSDGFIKTIVPKSTFKILPEVTNE